MIITGANTGLGFEAAKKFAILGANTIVLCKTNEKGAMTEQKLRKETGNENIKHFVLDLASLKSIHSCAEQVYIAILELHKLVKVNKVFYQKRLKRNSKL